MQQVFLPRIKGAGHEQVSDHYRQGHRECAAALADFPDLVLANLANNDWLPNNVLTSLEGLLDATPTLKTAANPMS